MKWEPNFRKIQGVEANAEGTYMGSTRTYVTVEGGEQQEETKLPKEDSIQSLQAECLDLLREIRELKLLIAKYERV